MHKLLFSLIMVGLVGCREKSSDPKTVFEARHIAVSARNEAQAAQQAGDASRTLQAAEKAEAVADIAARIISHAAGVTDQQKTAHEETIAAAREARLLAGLAEEEQRLADLTSSLKARAYRAARKVALSALFKSLAAAATLAGKTDLNLLPEEVRDSAQLAAELAEQSSHRVPHR